MGHKSLDFYDFGVEIVSMRYLSQYIGKDLHRKLVLLSGPRQVGKTTLAKSLVGDHSYLNFDVVEDRRGILERSWDRDKKLLILDELHKLKNWKSYLKGIVDSSNHAIPTIVTGSARLDVARKVGDSLAGRYFSFRLNPIDVKEATQIFSLSPAEALRRLLVVGGFPEPFLSNDVGEYRRWKTSHTDIILKQDLIQLETVEEIVQIETLVELLRDRVGSTIAYANLAKELQCAPKSVKRWLGILENLYVVFSVRPYSKKLTRSLVKAPKFYFYDCAQVRGDEGARFENLVALSIKKEIEFRQDCFGDDLALHFVRNKEKDEIDFVILKEGKPDLGIEAKWSDESPHKAFRVFQDELQLKRAVQLVVNLNREKTYPSGLEIRNAADWLARFSFAGSSYGNLQED